MIFPTPEFALFFAVVLPLSWLLMRRQLPWKWAMLAASYLFYAAADPRFCLLLGAITTGNWGAGRFLAHTDSERRRRWIVRVTVALDLLVLGVFKYYGFFVAEVRALGDDVGVPISVPLASFALPAGVSFYTFQAITYTVDVRRRVIAPTSLLNVALYLSFFPHLVAGPIVRAKEFMPQISSPRDPRRVAVGPGVVLIVLGLVKKLVLADYLARNVVDPVFAVPQAYGSADALLGIYAYAAQIYCDFSGYTDMAIGLALLLGVRFPQNFDRPYASLGFQEFWRRWHMTLSRFLRDFLYIPLGGNRGGRWRTSRNLFLTMVLGGLWHGAAWGFVLWGAIHGLLLVGERVARERVRWRPPVWLRWLVTFHLVALAWVPFRASDLATAGSLLSRLVEPGAATLWTPAAVGVVVAVLAAQLAPRRPLAALRAWCEARGPVMLGAGLALSVVVVGALIPSGEVPPFIYFQF